MRTRFVVAATLALIAAGCSDNSAVAPLNDDVPLPSSPSYALVDAANGGVAGFYFLPPLAKSPTIVGSNLPGLQPSMEVCQLTGNPSAIANPNGWDAVVCDPGVSTVTSFGPESVSAGTDNYAFSWDTSPGAAGNDYPMDPGFYYRIGIFLNGFELGYLDINPQVPSGQSPGDDYPDLYAFRLGENLPVKFVITDAAPCATTEGYVIQCAASAVVDQTGGSVTLQADANQNWSQLIVSLYPGVLPDPLTEVTVTIERIDPDLFEDAFPGTYCIPGLGGLGTTFDAPLFGQCLRVTTDPELPGPLSDYSAGIPGGLIELCIDPSQFSGDPGTVLENVTPEQYRRLQMIRYHDGTQQTIIQGLANTDAPGCAPPPPVGSASLLPVPEKGLFRFAALGINAVARLLGPTPLSAHGAIRLAGATSEFSIFRWGLPGQILPPDPNSVILQRSSLGTPLSVSFQVVDNGTDENEPPIIIEPDPIYGATVHFSASGGALSSTAATTVEDGLATVSWNLANAVGGVYTLDAEALGLLGYMVPDHDEEIDFTPATVTFTVTVAGDPDEITLTGTLPGVGPTVSSLWPSIGATVTDAANVEVTDANITWTVESPGCTAANEPVCGTFVGGTWTLGQIAGTNILTGTVAGTNPAVTIADTVITVADSPFRVVKATAPPTNGDLQTGPINQPLTDSLRIEVLDQYGNRTANQDVTWDDDGLGVSAWPYIWTLGPTPNFTYTAAAYLDGVTDPTDDLRSAIFTATAICNVKVDGVMNADEWACAQSASFPANISGGTANAEVYWQNYGDSLYLAVKVFQADPNKANSVRFDFDRGTGSTTVDDVHSAGDDAIGVTINKGSASFFDEYLTAKCANNSQSGCGSRNEVQDGHGDFDPTKTGYITYELSHPLNSGDPTDFNLTKGDWLGFFITLQNGNGAQGNTQWPGFRQFKQITIR